MSDYPEELRAKVTAEMHRQFHAICQAFGEDATARIRRIVQADIDSVRHTTTVLARTLLRDGTASETKGSES